METFVAVEVEEKKMDGPRQEPAIFDGNVTYSDSKNKEKRGRPRLDPAEVKRRALEKAARKAEKSAEKERLIADELAAKKELERYKEQLREERRAKAAAAKAAAKEAREAERARKKHDDDVARARKKAEKEEEQRRKQEEDNRYRLRQVEIQKIVIDILNRTTPSAFPNAEPDIIPAIWEDEKGERHIVEIDLENNTCRDTGMEHVRSGITRMVQAIERAGKENKEYCWNDKQIVSCSNLWRMSTLTVGKPKPWAFKSERELTYLRHNFDPDPSMPTPVADELFGRILDPDTVKAWIGGIFVKGSYNQQYLVIQGAGGDGKGSLSRFLGAILGDEFFGAQEPPKNQFFGTMFSGKKLVCFQDLRDRSFYQSPVLLGATGGDFLQLEQKNKDMVNERDLECRILILTNITPKVVNNAHDLRRILWTSIAPLPEDVEPLSATEYQARIMAEAAGIVGKCIEEYYRRCPTPRPLIQPPEVLAAIKAFADDDDIGPLADELNEFIYQKFAIIPADPDQKNSTRPFVSAQTVKEIIQANWPRDTLKYHEKIKKILIKNGINVASKKIKKQTRAVYFGLGLKGGVVDETGESMYSWDQTRVPFDLSAITNS